MRFRGEYIFFKFSLLTFLISLFLLILSRTSSAIATILNTTLSQYIRNALSYITSLFEYSVFEGIVLALLPIIFVSVIYIFSAKTSPLKRFLNCLSPILITASIYALTLGISYSAEPVFNDIITPRQELSDDDYYASAKKLVAIMNENGNADNRSYTTDEIVRSARAIFDDRSSMPVLSPKEGELSNLLTSVGVVSYYSFLTGEIIMNNSIPEYMTPFVLAHEYSHSIGISSEADAEICAYLILSRTDNRFLRYSASLCALEYIYPYLSIEEKREIYSSLPTVALADITEHRSFFGKYSDTASALFDGLNEAHSSLHGSKDYSYTAILLATLLTNE